MAKFKKGQTGNKNGRPVGAQNRLTKTVRETVFFVFGELQQDPQRSLLAFAKKYPRDFYQIAAKLIPQDVSAQVVVRKIGKDLEDEIYV